MVNEPEYCGEVSVHIPILQGKGKALFLYP